MTREQWQSIKVQLTADRKCLWTLMIWLLDLGLLAASWVLWIRTNGVWTHLAAEILALVALVQTFLIMHEATHGVACPKKHLNDLVGHVSGFLIGLPFLTRQRTHHLHHAWAGHPVGDPENRRMIARFAVISQREAARVEFIWQHWIPLIALNACIGAWLDPFQERAVGDRSARIRKEIRFAWIYLAGYLALGTLALATHCGRELLCWYVPVWIGELMMLELLTLPHHVEAPLLPEDSPRLPYWEQDAVSRSCETLPFWSRFVILNFNLHTAHHAFPALPWYRLPEAQRLLSTMGVAGETPMNELGWSIRKRQQPLLKLMGQYFDKKQ